MNQTTIELTPFDPIGEAVDVSTAHRSEAAQVRRDRNEKRRQLKCSACGEVIGRTASVNDRTPIEIKEHRCPYGDK